MKSSNFVTVIRGEAKNFVSKKKLVTFLLTLVFVMIVISNDAINSKQYHEDSKSFQTLEGNKFKKAQNYTVYSVMGVRFIFSPSVYGAFLSMSDMDKTTAKIDIVNLSIEKILQDGGVLSSEPNSPISFSFLLILIGTISCMVFGADVRTRLDVYKDKIIDLTGRKSFFYICLARAVIILIILFVLFLSVPITLFINGINPSFVFLTKLAGYFLAAAIMLYVAFLIGVVVGFNREAKSIITILLIVALIFIYLVPGALRAYIKNRTKNVTSMFIIHDRQLSIVDDFEKTAAQRFGKFNENELEKAKAIMNGYYESDYKKIEAVEDNLYNELKELIKLHNVASLFTPITFFQMTAADVSSVSYENFLKFYDMLKVEKRRFLRFYIDQTTKERPLILIPFETQHVFYAKGSLPELFWYGVLFNLALIAVLYFWANRLYENKYYRIDKIKMDTKEVEIRLKSGRLNLMLCYFPGFLRLFLSVVHGKKRYFKGKVFMDDKPLDLSKNDIFYLIGQAEMPGEVLLGDFLNAYQRFMKMSNDSYAGFLASVDNSLLSKKIRDISPSQRTDILLSLAENCGKKIIVFLMFLEGVPREKEHPHTNRIKALKAAGKTVCYFSGSSNDVIDGDVYYNIAPGEGQYGAAIVA